MTNDQMTAVNDNDNDNDNDDCLVDGGVVKVIVAKRIVGDSRIVIVRSLVIWSLVIMVIYVFDDVPVWHY